MLVGRVDGAAGPPAVATTRAARTPPLADPSRYDRLRNAAGVAAAGSVAIAIEQEVNHA
jgi:hypothetical protein